jgi:hypothetical protein
MASIPTYLPAAIVNLALAAMRGDPHAAMLGRR